MNKKMTALLRCFYIRAESLLTVFMSPYEEKQMLAKQISAVHQEISKLYQRMSQRHEEYFWTTLEKLIEEEKKKSMELRLKLKDATYRFVNWQSYNPNTGAAVSD